MEHHFGKRPLFHNCSTRGAPDVRRSDTPLMAPLRCPSSVSLASPHVTTRAVAWARPGRSVPSEFARWHFPPGHPELARGA